MEEYYDDLRVISENVEFEYKLFCFNTKFYFPLSNFPWSCNFFYLPPREKVFTVRPGQRCSCNVNNLTIVDKTSWAELCQAQLKLCWFFVEK